MSSKKIIIALDSNNFGEIEKLVKSLKNDVYAFKIGYQFFFNFGLIGYKKIFSICPKIFLDLKLHDIPNTVKNGLEALNKIKPILTTIHISGGDEMMKSSVKSNKFTKILGVSILTSMDTKQTKKFYNQENVSLLVKKFAKFAKKNGLDGVVCSPKEIKVIRKETGKDFIIVTPGIRLKNKIKSDDQKRVETPEKAIEMGANYLVIGRPITKSKSPLKTLKEINKILS
ncbi:orotidine-5'-phosphate decarboxylase [Pelagibacteraceae bacterium]|nr:orotidine-5'-phosphate decarboxylase [Pelagibacteraceae bacterium]